MDYIAERTFCKGKREFARVLRDWIASDHEAVIGEPGRYKRRGLVRVEVGAHRFHLNADTQDAGVREYLTLVDQHGDDLRWHVITNRLGNVNAVAFGDPVARLKHFYLYADSAAAAPYDV